MNEILLVEDSDTDAELIRRTLMQAGVSNPVRRLADGVEAMDYLRQSEEATGPPIPSILLLDLKLPGMTGFEILEYLVGRPAFSKMLTVVLTSLDDTNSIKKAYNLGANSFIVKPAHQQEIRELIKTSPAGWLVEDESHICSGLPRWVQLMRERAGTSFESGRRPGRQKERGE